MTRPHQASDKAVAQFGETALPDGITDRIFLRDYVVQLEIGAFRQERGRRQRVRFTIVADLMPTDMAPANDDVDAILSYDTLLQAIDDSLAAGRIELLETLADRIAERVLAADRVAEVSVRVEKLDRIDGALGVEIVRDRSRRSPVHAATPRSRNARVVYFERAALDAPSLRMTLDQLAAQGGCVVCVDAPAVPSPRAPSPKGQWQIDLLALEQSAWQVASLDARCIVVATRTEIDWGLREGHLLVWAPSKLVLDNNDPDLRAGAAPRDLAVWLARSLGAPGLEDAAVKG